MLKYWRRAEIIILIIDLIMLGLAVFNLSWILFDGLYASHFVQDFFIRWWPAFHEFYLPIHQNFALYDLWFVGIFLTELLIRWALAVWNRQYHRWWFYPIVHWYDVLGCAPVGSFRILRLFRIVAILLRLQRNRVVDLTRTYLFRMARKYYRVIVEEVSDRVVLNVLDGFKSEVRRGNPVAERIIREVVEPVKPELVNWISDRVQGVMDRHYEDYRPDVQAYVDQRIREAVDQNKEIGTFEAIPVLGGTIRKTLESAIADITFHVLNGLIEDLASSRNKAVIDELSEVMVDAVLFEEEDRKLDEMVRNMVVRAVDVVEEEVKVQQWKLDEERERLIRERARRIRDIRARKGRTSKS